MKRKTILSAMLLVLTGIVLLQCCKQEEGTPFREFLAAVPGTPEPANAGIITRTGGSQIITLTWTGTATNPIQWEVYFGNTSSPALVASDVAVNSYDVQVTTGGKYYWQVKTVDANNVRSESPVWEFEVNSNPNIPDTPVPDSAAVDVSCTATLSWSATDPEDDPLTFDLLFDQVNPPVAVAATGLDAAEYAITTALSANNLYYWKVVAHDPYGGVSESPVWKFTTGALPIAIFTGNYKADEPAEATSYTVSFTMISTTTINTGNYWNSGWSADFTIDLTNLTYNMPLTVWGAFSGIESGIVDPATGTMTGTYTIWNNTTIIEQGVHTYTKL